MNQGNVVRFEARLEQRLAELRRDLTIEMSRNHSSVIRWMFTFWLPTALGMLGTAIAVVALFIRK